MKNTSTYRILILLLILVFGGKVWAQFGEDFEKKAGNLKFKTKVDKYNFSTTLTITNKDKTVYRETFPEFITDINEYDFNNDGKKYIIIDFYSGGAHCCTSIFICSFTDNKFRILDTAFYGNSGYLIEDINNDRIFEIKSGNDMFAYAFTNYAETRFPMKISRFDGNKIVNVTSEFRDIILNEIEYFKGDLEEYTSKGFDCPAAEDEDTFNTDAGSVKTILAAITADYFSIGETEKGYELIDKVYKCVDKDKFKKILKEDFQLK